MILVRGVVVVALAALGVTVAAAMLGAAADDAAVVPGAIELRSAAAWARARMEATSAHGTRAVAASNNAAPRLIVRPASPGAWSGAVFATTEEIERARTHARDLPPLPPGDIKGLVVPHHWLAGHLIVAGLQEAAARHEIQRVVLIGPDHPRVSPRPAMTTDQALASGPYVMAPEEGWGAAAAASPSTAVAPQLLAREHSVAGLAPALASALPGVPVIALAVRGDPTREEVDELASLLAPWLDADTLLVASADFSHGLTPGPARLNDEETWVALTAFDTVRLLAWGPEHLDAPGALAVAGELMRRQGAQLSGVLRTDSAELGADPATVTSYVLGAYVAGTSPGE